MRSQLRLRVLLPLGVLGLLGAGFGAFAMNGVPETPQPPLAAANTGETEVEVTTEASPPTPEKPAGKKKSKKKRAAPARTPLERALADRRVVVVLFYAPDASYDKIQTREARAGAHAARAGFLAVDVSDDGEAAALATEYEVRNAPATLVFRRGPRVAQRLSGYADGATVEQAAVDARRR